MANEYSIDELLGFLGHASERGLMPAATAMALAVASRNVFGVLADHEKADVRALDLTDVINRFSNKRAREFNPSSLTAYGLRVQRAVKLFVDWRGNPASFTVKTRSTKNAARKERSPIPVDSAPLPRTEAARVVVVSSPDEDSFETSVPVRQGQLITISNVPKNLTAAEAARLADFVKMLAVE